MLAQALKLFELELRDHQPLPALAGAHQRGEDEFEHRPVAKGMRDHLGFPPLFAKQTLKEVGGAGGAPVGNRQLKMRDLGLEVIQKTGCGASVLTLVAGNELLLGQVPVCAKRSAAVTLRCYGPRPYKPPPGAWVSSASNASSAIRGTAYLPAGSRSRCSFSAILSTNRYSTWNAERSLRAKPW